MSEPPDLRELLPDDVGPEELARLARLHELLLRVGPPAELPAHLDEPPVPGLAPVLRLVRRRWRAVGVVAAAAAAAVFGVGFLAGYASKESGFETHYRPVAMRGTGPTASALAQIWVGHKDAALNWPSVMKVRGLPILPGGGYYALYLTDERTGKRVLLCAAFAVHPGVTTVTFTFPGHPDGRGWIVVREQPGHAQNGQVVLETEDGATKA
jgi:hypothetical protein